MSEKFDDPEKEIKKKDEKINRLEKTIENLVEKKKSLSSEIDDLEHTRNEMVWFCMVSMKATTRTPMKS